MYLPIYQNLFWHCKRTGVFSFLLECPEHFLVQHILACESPSHVFGQDSFECVIEGVQHFEVLTFAPKTIHSFFNHRSCNISMSEQTHYSPVVWASLLEFFEAKYLLSFFCLRLINFVLVLILSFPQNCSSFWKLEINSTIIYTSTIYKFQGMNIAFRLCRNNY